jgi:hypothetical protein
MSTKIQIRRDLAANWTSANPILASGEIGYETDTGKLKIGNGAASWTSLTYFEQVGSHTHTLADITDAGTAAALNVAASGDAASGEVVKGDDTRLTDSRTPTAHTHTKSDITDFSDGDYAAALHTHTKSDITDFSDGDYAPAVHTHTKADITDFSDGDYAPAVHTHTKSDITDFSDGDYAPASHTHTLSEVTDAGTSAALNVAASGDAAAGEVVKGDDSRLTDPRTPTAHTHVVADITDFDPADKADTVHTHVLADVTDAGTAAALNVAAIGNAAAGEVVKGNDSRLTDARTPTAHTHPQSDIVNLTTDLAAKADLVGGKVPTSQIPDIAISMFLGNAADQAAQVSLTGEVGDWCIRTDQSKTYIITANDGSVFSDWTEIATPAAPVSSVNGLTGVVVLGPSDVGAAAASHTHTKSQITDFSDADYAAAVHTHTKSDITDFSDADYAAALHTHTKSDITDFSDADYAAALHTHTKSDITDFSDADYAPAVHTHVLSDVTDAGTAAALNVPATGNASAGEVVKGNDSRLTDSRTPTAHTHVKADITDFSDADYAAAVHTHTKSQITDFSDGDYAAAVHTHTKSDITDFNDADYAAASHTHTLSEVTDAGTAAALNVAASGDAAVGEVVKGNDSRLADARTPTSHTHPISAIVNLQAELNGKAATFHSHAISDVTGLQTALDGKASSSHTHAIADVTGLQTALDGKAATSHTHAIANVTGLQTALDGKAATSHTHAIADVTGLQTALDGKAATSHTHTIANITNLQTTLDGKASTTTSISAGTGLTGGGTLAANRTLSVTYGTTAGTSCQGNDTRLSDPRTPLAHTHTIQEVTLLEDNLDYLDGQLANKVPTSRTISAGDGLTGGGDLTANRTLSVNTGPGLAVAGGMLKVDTGSGLYFDTGLKVAANAQQIADAYTMTVANLVVGQYYPLDINCPAARDLTVLTAICNTGTVTLQFLKNGSTLGMLNLTTSSSGNTVPWTGQDLTVGNSFTVIPTAITGGCTAFTVQVNYTQQATVL